MKKNDNGMEELLELLKSHPELISALVFDPAKIKRLLKSKAARRLLIGVDTRAFLKYVASSENGTYALCQFGTRMLCPGTKRPPICWPRTKGSPGCPGTKQPG